MDDYQELHPRVEEILGPVDNDLLSAMVLELAESAPAGDIETQAQDIAAEIRRHLSIQHRLEEIAARRRHVNGIEVQAESGHLRPDDSQEAGVDVDLIENPYEIVLSGLLAADAGRQTPVVTFRDQYLPNGLIEHQEVDVWIDAHASGGTVEASGHSVLTYVSVNMGYGTWPLSRPAEPGTPLETLAELGAMLAECYGWSEAEATVFVLTGRPPEFIEFEARLDDSRPIPATWKIEMAVSPMLSPAEVAERYQEFRAQRLGGGHRRARRPSPRNAVLAWFDSVIWPGVSRAKSWASRRTEWNVLCRIQGGFPKKWRYESESNMRRDAGAARRALLFPPYLTRD